MNTSSSTGAMPVNDVQSFPEIEELLAKILACVGEEVEPNGLPPADVDPEEVVFDIQVDGVRYTLTRTHPQSSNSQVNLSPREQEIVRLVAKGHPNKIIAAVLDISPWTVSTHLRRIFAKLAVNSRAEMVARVFNEDLLSGDV